MLRTAWTEEWDRDDTPAPLGMPLQPMLTGAAIDRINRAAHQEGSGAEGKWPPTSWARWWAP
ncbi:MAG: hypothetical protein Ct9H300mP12_06400 [Acidimicrobiales bacterium]|nr:MAG: hypothetical protein Ct9H300mP12_06400 [Acidimicrobiales bacterium]